MTSIQHDWDTHKELLSNLYRDQNWSRLAVAKHMETHYGFVRSLGQYERQFRKWEWRKNTGGKGWRYVDLKLRKRKRAGLESEVVLNGIVQPAEKIRKELQRHVPELTAYIEDGPSPQVPPGIQVRTPLTISGNSHPEECRWISTTLSNHVEGSLSLILPFVTKLPSFMGLEILREAFLSRISRNRFEQVDGSTYPSGCAENLDLIHKLKENQLMQGSYSTTDAPGFHVGVWCKTGTVPNGNSTDCNIVPQSDALLSMFDMISSPIPILKVEKSTLEHYFMLRRVFILNNSKQLAPNSKALKDLLPLLKTPLSQAFLKELLSADKIAGQDLVETLLHSAILAKNSSIVEALLRLGCDPNQQVLDIWGKKSLLRLAAEMGELSVVKILVDRGAKVGGMPAEGHQGATPLIAAIDGGFLKVAEYLLRCESQVNSSVHLKHCHRSPLVAAVRLGNLEMTRLLLNAETHFDSQEWVLDQALCELTMSYSVRSDQDGRNEILEMLLAGGANPRCIVHQENIDGRSDDDSEYDSEYDSDDESKKLRAIRGWTALEMSAERGHLDFVATLLEHGAQVSENAALGAIERRHTELACFLLGKMECDSLSHPNGYEMLRTAIYHKNSERITDLVRALLKAGAKPNKFLREDWGHGPDGDEDSGFDSVVEDIVNSKNESSEPSPLEIAAERGHAESLDLLLSAGAWIIPPEHPHYNFQTEGPTVLDRAAKSGNIEVLERVLEAGADIPSSREALVHVIEKLQNPEIVWWLIQGGVDVKGSTVKKDSTITTPIQAAIRIRNRTITQILLDAGADETPTEPHPSDGLSCRALCDAIKAQDHNLINILLQSEVDVNHSPEEREESEDDTPLEAAVANEDLNLVFKLLQLGSDPDDSRALLAAAMPERPAAFLDALLNSSIFASRSPHYGCAALQLAIRTLDYAKVQRLLQAGVKCDLPAFENRFLCRFREAQELYGIYGGLSALGSALKFDQGQCGPMLRIIFAAAMNPNALVDYDHKHTGLQFAVANRRYDLVKFLIAGGADVNFNCPKCRPKTRCAHIHDAPICIAVESEDIELVKVLLSNGAYTDAKDGNGHAPLTRAASFRNIDLVQTLLDAGAAVNTNGSGRMCPALEAATWFGSVEIVRRLLRAGASASGTGSNGNSPALCYAVRHDYLETVRILLEAGADANVSADDADVYIDRDEEELYRKNMSAIQFCAAQASVQMAALLVHWGADVNTRVCIGEACRLKTLRRMKRDGTWLPPLSPLEEAAARGHLDMLQLLLDSGATTHGNGARQYKRALGYARRECNHAAVKLLKKRHAAEGALRQLDEFGGMNGLQGEPEPFQWGWEVNSEIS